MNSEEKILSLLEKMQGDISDIKTEQVSQRKMLEEYGKDISAMKERVDRLDERVGAIEVTLETIFSKKIDILFESQQSIIEKMERFRKAADAAVETNQLVFVMRDAIHAHSKSLMEHDNHFFQHDWRLTELAGQISELKGA